MDENRAKEPPGEEAAGEEGYADVDTDKETGACIQSWLVDGERRW